MSLQRPTYSFERLPMASVDGGTNLLVTGPALGGVRELLLTMLVRTHPREGAIIIASDTDGRKVLSQYESLGGELDAARVGVIDCAKESGGDETQNIHAVGSPSDLTGVGIEFSSLYERLAANGATGVRVGIYTLTPFVMYADTQPVYRFLHTLAGRIRTADGLGVCAVDPETLDDRTLSSLAQAFDGRVELTSREGEPHIRLSGLPDQPEGWQPVDLPV